MRRIIAVIGILDTLATIVGAVWWLVAGSLPATVTSLFSAVQTAFWIIVGIAIVVGVWFGVLIWRSQRETPYLERTQ